jgi:hypothetical protein
VADGRASSPHFGGSWRGRVHHHFQQRGDRRARGLLQPGGGLVVSGAAGNSILNRSGQAIELADIEVRVAELERAAEHKKQ